MLLTNKRDVVRGKAPFEENFLCTMKGVPYGIWMNVEKMKEMGREEALKELDKVLLQLR